MPSTKNCRSAGHAASLCPNFLPARWTVASALSLGGCFYAHSRTCRWQEPLSLGGESLGLRVGVTLCLAELRR